MAESVGHSFSLVNSLPQPWTVQSSKEQLLDTKVILFANTDDETGMNNDFVSGITKIMYGIQQHVPTP
eukprot:scaffold62278_cov17-Tisochrysis_lutea.AAC.1